MTALPPHFDQVIPADPRWVIVSGQEGSYHREHVAAWAVVTIDSGESLVVPLIADELALRPAAEVLSPTGSSWIAWFESEHCNCGPNELPDFGGEWCRRCSGVLSAA